tara:strand:- start:314 stop:1468 length:1155 start_codon:yes stop_codon:yes gene_type:complete
MATLSGTAISSTFDLLLKVNSNGLDGTLRAIQDGDATDSVLFLATDSALISGNGTKLYFYDADGGEHIAADNSANLTITAGTDIELKAGSDINIPADIGLTFGHASNQKIEGDGTDLAITATGNVNVTSTVDEAGSVKIEENAGTSGTVRIYANQGTGADSINIESDVGGITLDAGSTSEGVKVGTVTGVPITIGHTTSETTVADNLTTTGDTAVGGTLTVTGTITASAGASTFGVASDEITVFNPASYTDAKGGGMTGGTVIYGTTTGRVYTSGAGTGSVNGSKFQIDTPTLGSDSYIVSVSAHRGGDDSNDVIHYGGVYALNINADSEVSVDAITENDSDSKLSVTTGSGFANFVLAQSAVSSNFVGNMKINALKLIRGSDT